MSIRDEIMSTFRRVADVQGRRLAPLSDELQLTECGLDSLSFALVVSNLEDTLNVDPFNSEAALDFPVTVGDFIGLYERAGA